MFNPFERSARRAYRVYGDSIPPERIQYFRRCEYCLVAVCTVGVLLQIISVPGPVAIEWACAFVYLLYNVTGMLVVRVLNVGFKFEDKSCLWCAVSGDHA